MRRILTVCLVCITLLGGCTDEQPVESVPGPDNTGSTGVSMSQLYDDLPDIANCYEGRLKETERQKVLTYINSIRSIHGLPAVSYRGQDDALTAKSALIIAANNLLAHQPPQSASCWSQEGYDGSSISNLGISLYGADTLRPTSEYLVQVWFRDSATLGVGHRRWLLDPFLKYISFSRVDKTAEGNQWRTTGSAVSVIYDEHQDISTLPIEFVAFPFHDYSTKLCGSGITLSFSVLVDKNDFWSNGGVDYSAATIEMTPDGGGPIQGVQVVSRDNNAYGLQNVLEWIAPVQRGVRYSVRISGVRVKGNEKSYTYWFSLQETA